jgi:hypothetical protein
MGGFRIASERPIVVCYRDCGIIGFDYKAAVEWQKRLNDVDGFKVFVKQPAAVDQAVKTAILKYHVNYIVFMTYIQPGKTIPILEYVYANEVFALYKVNVNPVGEK